MGKRMISAYKLFDRNLSYSLFDAIDILYKYREGFAVKFNESVDIQFCMGIDSTKSDQNIKGFAELPHNIGKTIKIVAFVDDPAKINDLKKIGVFAAGADDLITEIELGKLSNFDKCIATPSMMPKLTKIAKILGPAGLMPNPKFGTVTEDIASVVKSLMNGRIDIKNDKHGSVKIGIGKLNFDKNTLVDNIRAVYVAIKNLKPSTFKGDYFKSVSITTTMGVGVRLNLSDIYAL